MTEFSCAQCGVYACKYQDGKKFPNFCLTKADIAGEPASDEIEAIRQHLCEDNEDARVYQASVETEGFFFCKNTRVEEVIEFAKRLGCKKIGIATCHGLIRETKILSKILKANGFDCITVGCKVGNLDKTQVGIEESTKIKPGGFEAACNPILQAKILNAHQTDLNVIMGLCVGHDSLFMKYADAIVTTLITKDRVLGHSPALALYTAEEYRPWLLDPTIPKR